RGQGGGDEQDNGEKDDRAPGLGPDLPEESIKAVKYWVRGVSVVDLNERIQYYDAGGNLITENLKEYCKPHILEKYASLSEFIQSWTNAEKKQAIVRELEEHGVLLEALKEEAGQEIDDFDLILHIAYDQKPLTERERVDNVKKKGYLYKYS